MYFDSESTPENSTLANLSRVSDEYGNPKEETLKDPEIMEAFEEGVRQLAEDIVQYHPGLAHVLLGMGDAPSHDTLHGQN